MPPLHHLPEAYVHGPIRRVVLTSPPPANRNVLFSQAELMNNSVFSKQLVLDLCHRHIERIPGLSSVGPSFPGLLMEQKDAPR